MEIPASCDGLKPTAAPEVFTQRSSRRNQNQGKREWTKSAKKAAKGRFFFAAFFARFVPSRLPCFWAENLVRKTRNLRIVVQVQAALRVWEEMQKPF